MRPFQVRAPPPDTSMRAFSRILDSGFWFPFQEMDFSRMVERLLKLAVSVLAFDYGSLKHSDAEPEPPLFLSAPPRCPTI